MRRRVNVQMVICILLFCVVAGKLFVVQILESEKYKLASRKQYETKIVLYPTRGLIFDRNMNLMVSNTYSFSLAADPNMVTEPEKISVIISEKTSLPKEEVAQKLVQENTSFVYLAKDLSPEKVSGLDTLSLPGIIILKEPKRVYNYGSLASQLIGFTNDQNEGLTGLEQSYNKQLSGKQGFMIMHKDGKGNLRPVINYPQKEPVKGNNIVLTLDINIQRIAEEEISSAVRQHGADVGKVVVMSVKTGEILGMASYPTFDPNNIKSSDSTGMMNRVISDLFEPGSTFKLVTYAASLEERTESISSVIGTEGGVQTSNGISVKDEHGSGSVTLQQALEQSSNVATMKVAKKLGKERFYKYARDFGFGIYSGIELPLENRGSLKRPIDFSGETLEYMSIGYQVAVNTLQLAAAYNTIANGGNMMKPFLVKKEMGIDGSVVQENMPISIRQVVTSGTARTLTALLTGVVQRGTGQDAEMEDIMVAGKTGTSQRIVNGAYSSNSHIGSFIGYFPAEDPQILIAVVMDNPKSGQYYGGKVSAPIFKQIASRIVEYTGSTNYSQPNMNTLTEQQITNVSAEFVLMPNLLKMRYDDAVVILEEMKIPYEPVKNGSMMEKYIIASQVPMPNERIIIGSDLKAILELKPLMEISEGLSTVPDVRGLTLRRGISELISAGFTVEINGSGKIIGMQPEAGSKKLLKSKITLFCENQF